MGPEVCQPSDTRPEKRIEAYFRKLQKYEPVRIPLQKCTALGWQCIEWQCIFECLP